jgi:hypothetical protein
MRSVVAGLLASLDVPEHPGWTTSPGASSRSCRFTAEARLLAGPVRRRYTSG